MAEHTAIKFSEEGLDANIRALSRVYNGDKIESEDYEVVGQLLTSLYKLRFRDPSLPVYTGLTPEGK